MSDYKGEFVWYDLMTTDVDAAKAFYSDIIGWGTQDWDGGPAPYTMFTVKDKPIGGLMTLPEQAQSAGAPSHWLAYVGTTNIDATFKKVQELGGTPFVPPTDIPKIGKFCIFADPKGGVMAAFTTPETGPTSTKAARGTFPGTS